MRRIAPIIIATLAALPATGVGVQERTSLRVELSVDGVFRSWTLRCDPAVGTLPNRSAACARLARLSDLGAPVAPTACIAGFPSWLTGLSVRGTIRGVSVRRLLDSDYRCWGSTSGLGLGRALGVGPHLVAPTTRIASAR